MGGRLSQIYNQAWLYILHKTEIRNMYAPAGSTEPGLPFSRYSPSQLLTNLPLSSYLFGSTDPTRTGENAHRFAKGIEPPSSTCCIGCGYLQPFLLEPSGRFQWQTSSSALRPLVVLVSIVEHLALHRP